MSIYSYEPDGKDYLVEVEYGVKYITDSDYAGEFTEVDAITYGEITYHDDDGDVFILTESELEDVIGYKAKYEIDQNIETKAKDGYDNEE